ncbi:TIGR02444 family protein [Aestuariispira insulae]|uniref:Uncharacterized protein (TIGR02444 family) n=1 Tax=Aestuariispira insulae TaxID=1461337 RepID=A0A3D9HXB5_9PROT|nr:TIGR02444 family protein [Aestuariispira insulae]RED54137.1 uncharacterized protein (TIGR02444 family) [Aestuariispira insulae]
MTFFQDKPSHPFWAFSLDFYGKVRVEETLLALQNSRGLDVNLILLCVWLGTKGVSLQKESMQKLVGLSSGWHLQAVLPLRQLRQSLKEPVAGIDRDDAERVRQGIKELELATERMQQDMLFQALEELPGKDARLADRAGVIRGNLSRYASAAAIRVGGEERGYFETLVQAAI